MNKAKDSILAVWQPQGVSTNRLSQITGEHFGVSSSHTGTLDPMAEGVVIILLGEHRLKKYDYAHWLKTYEFEIIFGISTDTLDSMGLTTSESKCVPLRKEIGEIIPSFLGKYYQNVPMYSAVKLKGKKLFEWARNGKTFEQTPIKKGEIFELKLLNYGKDSLSPNISQILKRLRRIKGDFRQELIASQWESKLRSGRANKTVIKAKFRVRMTKGLYVRSLAQDICAKLNCLGFTYSIKRTRNGEYGRKEALKVQELFGSRQNFYNLISGVKS